MTLPTGKKGFTLIEMIIVLSIISIMGYIIMPNFINFFDNVKKSARINELKNNLSVLKKAAIYQNSKIVISLKKNRVDIDNEITFSEINDGLQNINSTYGSSRIEISENGAVSSGEVEFIYGETVLKLKVSEKGEVTEVN